MRSISTTFGCKAALVMGVSVSVFLGLASQQAHADDAASTTAVSAAPLAGVSTANTTMNEKKPTPLPIAISDYSLIQGPAVDDLKSSQAADDAAGTHQPISSRQYFSTTYLINPEMSVGPVLDFTYNFNAVPGAYEKGITWNDSFLTFRKKNVINTKVGNDDLTASVWFNYYAPTSHGSRLNSSLGEMAIWFNPSYQFHGSRWSLSAYNYAKYYAQTRGSDVTSGSPLNRWYWYAGPQVNYELSDSVTLFVLYEAVLRLYSNGQTDDQLHPGRSLTDLEPGVMWSVSKNVTLFPYFNWYLNQTVDSTSIGLNASFKFL